MSEEEERNAAQLRWARNAAQLRVATEKCIEHGLPRELADLVVAACGFRHPDHADWFCDLLLARAKDAVHEQRSFVGWLITVMLERCEQAQMPPSTALTGLVRAYTGADRFAANEIRAPGAFERAGWFLALRPKASLAELASAAGVSREAVRKWFDNDDLRKLANTIRQDISRAVPARVPERI